MRKIGAYIVFGAMAVALCPPSSAAAFGLRIGPFHIGIPLHGRLFNSWHPHRHRHRIAVHPATRPPNPMAARSVPAPVQAPQDPTAASLGSLYPGLALPTIYEEIFSPTYSSPWPFGYAAILHTAFAKTLPDQEPQACRQPDRGAPLTRHIAMQIKPSPKQAQLLKRLGGAVGMASGYLQKSCLKDIPPQPIARLKLMEWQIEEMAMALDIVRPPLQEFEQSLNNRQRARFAATRSAATAAAGACSATPSAIDGSIDQIDQSVQPMSDAQREALSNVKQTFSKAADDLDSHCPQVLPPTPLARLIAIEARLDASWRAVLSIEVALSNFAEQLNAQQRGRLDAMEFVAAR